MRLLNSSKNEFDEMEGTAYFPYFDEKITVIPCPFGKYNIYRHYIKSTASIKHFLYNA